MLKWFEVRGGCILNIEAGLRLGACGVGNGIADGAALHKLLGLGCRLISRVLSIHTECQIVVCDLGLLQYRLSFDVIIVTGSSYRLYGLFFAE